MNDLNKKRSSGIEGPILSQKLGADQIKSRHGTNLSLLARDWGGPEPSAPPGYAYDQSIIKCTNHECEV